MTLKFTELHHHCQKLTPTIPRNEIIRKAVELTGKEVKPIKSGLDINICRGFFLSASNKEHPLVKQMGCNIIVIARGLNRCWERFVHIKELMHLFDEEGELTGNAANFEKLLTEFGQPSVERPAQSQAEAKAFWMALSCFCPEKDRLEFQAQLAKGNIQIDNYQIALKLRIPEQYVPSLFVPHYPKIVAQLIKN